MIRTIPPFFSGGVRFLIAAGLHVRLAARARAAAVRADYTLAARVLCGVLMTGIGNGFVIWAQQGLPSGIAALFVGALPVLTLMLDWLFFSRRTPTAAVGARRRDRARRRRGADGCTRTRFSGSVRPDPRARRCSPPNWPGVPARCCSGATSAPSACCNFTCLQMLAGAVFQLLMGCIDREWIGFSPAHISLQSVLAVLYLVVFGSMIAVNCYSFLVAHVPAQKVTTYALVNPVIALALGALVLRREDHARRRYSRPILVLVGVALVLFQRQRPAAPGRTGLPEASELSD